MNQNPVATHLNIADVIHFPRVSLIGWARSYHQY